jgi:hypothetical protein
LKHYRLDVLACSSLKILLDKGFREMYF